MQHVVTLFAHRFKKSHPKPMEQAGKEKVYRFNELRELCGPDGEDAKTGELPAQIPVSFWGLLSAAWDSPFCHFDLDWSAVAMSQLCESYSDGFVVNFRSG